MSKRGQAWYQTNPNLYYGSVRTDAPPMPTGVRPGDLKLLYPADWDDYAAQRDIFAKESAGDASAPSATSPISLRQIAGYGVAEVAAVLVLHPVFFRFKAVLDVGDPQVRPPIGLRFR
jgi:hypothetical protein